jgi:hypothetical protein
VPDRQPRFARTFGRVDAAERDAAEQERVHGRGEGGSRDEAAGRHAAAVLGTSQQRAEDVAADRVDRGSPTRFEQRTLGAVVDFLAADDPCGAELAEQLMVLRLPRDGDDRVAESETQRGNRHATRGAGHHMPADG